MSQKALDPIPENPPSTVSSFPSNSNVGSDSIANQSSNPPATADPDTNEPVLTFSLQRRPSRAQPPLSPTKEVKFNQDEEYQLIEIGNHTNVMLYKDEHVESPKDLILSPEPTDAAIGKRQEGLSSEEATKKLLSVANNVLNEHRNRLKQSRPLKTYFSRIDVILTLCFIPILIGFYVVDALLSNPFQFRGISCLVETGCLILIVLWNAFLFHRETTTTMTEVIDRAQALVEQVQKTGLNMVQEIKIPNVPTVSVCKVVRDGIVRNFPSVLLVEGDIVELHYGDVAPCKCKYVYVTKFKFDGNRPTYTLNKNEGFRPELFGAVPPPSMTLESQINHGRFQFFLLETPLKSTLEQALIHKRPRTVFHNQLAVLEEFVVKKLLIGVIVLSSIVNVVRFILRVIKDGYPEQLVEMLFVLPTYAALPLIPFSLPTLGLVYRSWGNAQLLSLWEALQISKTDYEDEADIDEFDAEAPPPMKDVHIDKGVVLAKFLSLLTKWDKTCLTRSTNLLESLGTTSVFCCLDREGTITAPFPAIQQVYFPNEMNDKIIDVTEDGSSLNGIRFEDRDWMLYMPVLKPLGLILLLNTNCGATVGRRRIDQHRKLLNLYIHGKTKPARQSCLCMLGREIGFVDEGIKCFRRLKEIYAFAPYHPSLTQSTPDYDYETPSVLAQIYEDARNGSYQLMTDGSLEIVLDLCSDYWDGEDLRPMQDQVEKRIYDFYVNAIINDMQCVAYSYRPINTEGNSTIPFLRHDQDSFAYLEFPYSPPPLLKDSISFHNDSNQNVSNSVGGYVRPRRRSTRKKVDTDVSYKFDRAVTEDEERKFYSEVIHGQIFLGLATFVHHPKEDVCDVIEDLGLGGIRFVYFSPTGERQTKAFGETLGLETDWNSCILLSSPDDLHSSKIGYVEPHDIKARLPRGVENIRSHLQTVDDIPLHVSLFAESSAEATLEMIKIFQEYGEVVCCIGSSLHDINTALYAQADVSVAIEPLRSRVHQKAKKDSHAGPPPLAIGGSLISLPSALYMHHDTSLYALTQLIREARRLCGSGRQGVAFLIGSHLSLSFLILLSYCLFLPPLFSGYHIIWCSWLILPTLAISFMFNPHESDTMKLFTEKNIDHLKDFRRFMRYFMYRFSIAIAVSLIVFIL
ncbi:hypothetical protein BKA69DRAFT_1173903 [Paraphysoderma sedebokerense]|nr:hypothetical protein BKA69DRAFT_1173903 [Paraphysoderma sedebokerense]